jgi:hypothetical protein
MRRARKPCPGESEKFTRYSDDLGFEPILGATQTLPSVYRRLFPQRKNGKREA